MPKPKSFDEVYDRCVADGHLNRLETLNSDKPLQLLRNADSFSESLAKITQGLPKESGQWMTVFTLNYNILHLYAEALLLFDKVSSLNHICLFSALCVKHEELDLNWDFFQKIRTMRNGVHYYGKMVTYQDWKNVEIEFKLTLSLLRKEVEKRLT